MGDELPAVPAAAAVVVAHPDDEVIWCGGLILRCPGWRWTVLSLCRADDPDRADRFHRACDRLRVRGHIADLDDGNPLRPIDRRREIGGRITRILGDASWDLCLTHGANGEYGHRRHREVHREVRSLVARGGLACDRLWTFAYRCAPGAAGCRVDPTADVVLALTPEEHRAKCDLITAVYGFGEASFERRACLPREGFHRRSAAAQEGAP